MTRGGRRGALLILLVGIYGPVWQAGAVYEDWRWSRAASEPITLSTVWAPGARPVPRLVWRAPLSVLHVINVAFHLLVGGLVGVFLVALGASSLMAWIGAAVFLLHPLSVEAVAYATGLADVLVALGLVLAAIGVARRTLLLTILGVAVACFSKASAVALIGLLPLVAFRRVTWWSLVLLVGTVTAVAWWFSLLPPWLGPWARTQAAASFHLYGLALWPRGLTVDANLLRMPLALSWVGSVGFLAWGVCAWALRSLSPLAAFGAAWVWVWSVPRLFVWTPYSAFNEHQFYPAMIGVACLAAALGGWVWPTRGDGQSPRGSPWRLGCPTT